MYQGKNEIGFFVGVAAEWTSTTTQTFCSKFCILEAIHHFISLSWIIRVECTHTELYVLQGFPLFAPNYWGEGGDTWCGNLKFTSAPLCCSLPAAVVLLMCDEKKPQSKSITCHDHIQQQKLFSREGRAIGGSKIHTYLSTYLIPIVWSKKNHAHVIRQACHIHDKIFFSSSV